MEAGWSKHHPGVGSTPRPLLTDSALELGSFPQVVHGENYLMEPSVNVHKLMQFITLLISGENSGGLSVSEAQRYKLHCKSWNNGEKVT